MSNSWLYVNNFLCRKCELQKGGRDSDCEDCFFNHSEDWFKGLEYSILGDYD